MKLSKLINRVFNNNFYNITIHHFFEEVADDIAVLKNGEIYRANVNQIIRYLYADDKDLMIKNKEKIKERYKESYCSSSLFDYFNKSEKANYIMLRVEIDRLLDIKDTSYKI